VKNRIKYFNLAVPGGFSLLELLVVVALIMVLIGLLVPAYNRVREGQKGAQAKVVMGQLAIALQRYQSEYGRLPFDPDNKPTNETLTAVHLENLMKLLNDGENLFITGPKTGTHEGNPKNISFFPANARDLKKVGSLKNGTYPAAETGGQTVLVDPWGNSYMIALDFDGNDDIEVYGNQSVKGAIAIWSAGPNKIVEDNPGTTKVNEADDNLNSW
jgi:type II secretory pathway pseudopilin PulG